MKKKTENTEDKEINTKKTEKESTTALEVRKTTELSETGKKEKKSAKQKKEKPLKLPKIFKKKYSERKFKRKVLKRIYIPEDKAYVKSLFVQEESDNPKKPGKLYIPLEKKLPKKDLKKLKTIAVQIKKQKGRVKLLPLIASLSFIAAVIILFLASKNVLLTKVVKNLCENQFEARCDIGKLDLRLLDSSFTVKGFEIADKDEPMKNIFSFDSLVIDFDLVQLLKSKFVADEFSLEEIAVGSDRTYDGTLPEGKLKKIREKKAKKAAKRDEAKEKVTQSLTNATNQVKDNVTGSIAEIFETFNPKNILENCYAQLTTPTVVERIVTDTGSLIEKWKTTPDRVMVQVNNVKESTEGIINFDYNSIKEDPKKIKDMLQTFDAAFKTLNGVKSETETILSEIDQDVRKVNNMALSVQDSVEHDIDVTKSEINKLTSFRLPSGQEFLASTIDIYGYELLGKYYPMVKEGVAYLETLKDKQIPARVTEVTSKIPKKEKKPKKEIKRAAGRDVNFVKDRNPKFWIKKIAASGFNMSLNITDISNDMNKTERPTDAVFKFKYNDITHGGHAVVDIRTETTNPLVYLEYTCDGTTFAHTEDIPGVPQIKTNANYICNASVLQDHSFVLSGAGDFYNLSLTSLPFEPPYIFEIYKNILGRFDSANIGLEMKVSPDNGLTLHADTDLDEKIAYALKEEINNQLLKIKEDIEKEISTRIKAYTDQAKVLVDKFKEIENKIRGLENQLKDIEHKLQEKQNEMTNRLNNLQKKTEEAIKQKTEDMQNQLEEKLQQEAAKREEQREEKREEAKKAAEEAAGNALKGLFGGLKK